MTTKKPKLSKVIAESAASSAIGVPLRISANLAALNALAVADMVSACLARAAELRQDIPFSRKDEFDEATSAAGGALDAANAVISGRQALSSHDEIVEAAGHLSAAMAGLAAAGNVVRQILEANENPLTSSIAARLTMINRKPRATHASR